MVGLPEVVAAISQHAVGASREGWPGEVLLLLLRSSGDPGAEETRIGMLRAFGIGIASAAGWTPEQPGADEFLLRAQIVLSVAVGVVMIRSSSPELEPLGSATEEQIAGPLLDLVKSVLGPGGSSPHGE